MQFLSPFCIATCHFIVILCIFLNWHTWHRVPSFTILKKFCQPSPSLTLFFLCYFCSSTLHLSISRHSKAHWRNTARVSESTRGQSIYLPCMWLTCFEPSHPIWFPEIGQDWSLNRTKWKPWVSLIAPKTKQRISIWCFLNQTFCTL